MRRPLSLLCLGALAASGLAVSAPAAAAPAERASTTASAAVPDELLVGYVEGAADSERQRARGRAGAAKQEQVVRGERGRSEVELVRLPAGKDRDRAIAELEADPAVAYAEPNWIYTHQGTATDPYYTSNDPAGDLWGMYGDSTNPSNPFGSQAGETWAAGHTGSQSVYVGVIDEGIQFDHPDLAGQVWTNPNDPVDQVDNDGNGYVDDVHGWDFAGGNNTVYDGGTTGGADAHGTHVAGTIGAKADGNGVVGVNWDVTMISGKFLGASGGSLSNAVRAVDYFTDLKVRHGLNIVATSNSWGGGGYSRSLLDAITRGAKQQILFVAAAGNSGSNNDSTASYPSGYNTSSRAGYDAVIAVAAIDRTGGLASFSQYGASTVDLGAPGVGVWSTTPDKGYSQYNGTSMATPHVTGALALYAAAKPGLGGADYRTALLGSTAATPSLSGRTVTGGRLDAAKMLGVAAAPVKPVAPTASFTSACSGLTCTFKDTSQGEPTAWAWTTTDGQSDSRQHPSFSFAAAGRYGVTLTATNAVASSTSTSWVDVVAPGKLSVSATAGAKKKNVTPIAVTWSGFSSPTVTITRSGQTFVRDNPGSFTESVRGSGTLIYAVCETGTTTCATDDVSF